VLHRRLISATVLLGIAILSIALDLHWPILGQTGGWMIPLYLALTLGTAWEASQLLARRWSIQPKHLLVHASIACTVCLFPLWYSLTVRQPYPVACPVGRTGWILIGVLAGVGSSGIHALFLFQRGSRTHQEGTSIEIERTTLAWMLSTFVIVYVVGCMSIWFLVRMHGNSLQGMLDLIALLATVKFADTGAYFAGKLLGRHKLIPSISPGKTSEGLLGGMVASILIAYLFLKILIPICGGQAGTSLWGPALLGCLLTFVGLVGDLLESMIKRTVGAKDSGTLLPGLGGVWDVTDSLLPTAIVGYLGIIAKLT
jgi:phosphatidate cytidylyltransferase